MEAQKVLASAETLLSSCEGCSVLSEEQTVSLSEELSAVQRVLDESSEELCDERRVAVVTIYAQLCDTWMQLIGKPAVARLESVDVDAVVAEIDAMRRENESLLKERESLEATQRALADDCDSLRLENHSIKSRIGGLQVAYQKSISVSMTDDLKSVEDDFEEDSGVELTAEAVSELKSQLSKTKKALISAQTKGKMKADLSSLRIRRLLADSKAKSERMSTLTVDVNMLLAAISQQQSEMDDLYALIDTHKSVVGTLKTQATSRRLHGAVSTMDLESTVPLSEALTVADTLTGDHSSDDASLDDFPVFVRRVTAFDRLSVVGRGDVSEEPPQTAGIGLHTPDQFEFEPVLILSCESRLKLQRLKSAVSSRQLQRSDTRAALLLLTESDKQLTAAELKKKRMLSALPEDGDDLYEDSDDDSDEDFLDNETVDKRLRVEETHKSGTTTPVATTLTPETSPKKESSDFELDSDLDSNDDILTVVFSVEDFETQQTELKQLKAKVKQLQRSNDALKCEVKSSLQTESGGEVAAAYSAEECGEGFGGSRMEAESTTTALLPKRTPRTFGSTGVKSVDAGVDTAACVACTYQIW